MFLLIDTINIVTNQTNKALINLKNVKEIIPLDQGVRIYMLDNDYIDSLINFNQLYEIIKEK